jgi:hypothetical protein
MVQAAIAELQKQMKFLRQRVDQNQDRLEQTTARVDYLETAVEEDREKASLSIINSSGEEAV